ncbi:MAG: PAS domain-containing protein [Firmicutes bacterium]|nr:PAS domain-containing protein [Bacillota bacterium]
MRVRFVMDRQFPSIRPDEPVGVARWLLRTGSRAEVYVVDSGGRFLGVVRREDAEGWKDGQTLADVLTAPQAAMTTYPDADVAEVQAVFTAHPSWQSVAVVEDGVMCAVVHRGALAERATPWPGTGWEAIPADLYPQLLDAMQSGILVVDDRGVVRLLNRCGAQLLGVDSERTVGRPYEELAEHIFPHMVDYLRMSAVPAAMGVGAREGERQVRVANGRELLFRFGALDRAGGGRGGVVVTFLDVSELKAAQAHSAEEASEAERAFGLTLPNSKVESKLRTSPEYQDVYDPRTGRAIVTAVIPDGTYRHVINGLRIMADLKALDVFQLVGIDKDTLVQAFIFHDVGKEQPRLEVGQEFVPADTFEPGRLHAARSADWAASEYRVRPEAELLIRYHHTAEEDLPDSFPPALMPMYRLLRLVDGLSACLTRRGGRVELVGRRGSIIEVHEDNPDPRYDRRYELSLYTGAAVDCGHARGR